MHDCVSLLRWLVGHLKVTGCCWTLDRSEDRFTLNSTGMTCSQTLSCASAAEVHEKSQQDCLCERERDLMH